MRFLAPKLGELETGIEELVKGICKLLSAFHRDIDKIAGGPREANH